MNLSRVRAVVIKDLGELKANKMAMIPMIIVPVVLCVILPAVITFMALRLDISAVNGSALIERILPAYSIPEAFDTLSTRIAYVFLNSIFVPFFMLVPVMASSIVAANSVVGEKERRTLETLLYTPLTNKEFVLAKVLSAFLPAVVISVGGFIGFFVAVNGISLWAADVILVRSPLWIPAILLVSPGVSLLALGITLLISMKAKSYMEAQQMAAVVVIPFILLIIGQVAGLFVLGMLHVIAFGIVLLLVDMLILNKLGPRFQREAILKTL